LQIHAFFFQVFVGDETTISTMISFSRGRPTQRCQCRTHWIKGGDLHQDESPISFESLFEINRHINDSGNNVSLAFLREINSQYNDSAFVLDEQRFFETCASTPIEGDFCDPISEDRLTHNRSLGGYDPQFGLMKDLFLKQYSGVLSKLDDRLKE
jgi:hypothetical protein